MSESTRHLLRLVPSGILFICIVAAPLACHRDAHAPSSAGVGESGGGLGRTGAGASDGGSSSGNLDRPGGGTRGGLTGTGGSDPGPRNPAR